VITASTVSVGLLTSEPRPSASDRCLAVFFKHVPDDRRQVAVHGREVIGRDLDRARIGLNPLAIGGNSRLRRILYKPPCLLIVTVEYRGRPCWEIVLVREDELRARIEFDAERSDLHDA